MPVGRCNARFETRVGEAIEIRRVRSSGSEGASAVKRNNPPDDGLRSLIIKHLKTIENEAVLWQPIETALTASGVPDLYGCWRGHHVWVECKRTSGWTIKIDEFQVGWLLRLARAGGHGFVAVRRRCAAGSRRLAADELYLVKGTNVPRLLAEGLRNVPLTLLTVGGPDAWDWIAICVTLFKC
jgi:Holliday junction resolvase